MAREPTARKRGSHAHCRTEGPVNDARKDQYIRIGSGYSFDLVPCGRTDPIGADLVGKAIENPRPGVEIPLWHCHPSP